MVCHILHVQIKIEYNGITMHSPTLSGGVLFVRPDSGDPATVVVKVLEILGMKSVCGG